MVSDLRVRCLQPSDLRDRTEWQQPRSLLLLGGFLAPVLWLRPLWESLGHFIHRLQFCRCSRIHRGRHDRQVDEPRGRIEFRRRGESDLVCALDAPVRRRKPGPRHDQSQQRQFVVHVRRRRPAHQEGHRQSLATNHVLYLRCLRPARRGILQSVLRW